MSRAEKVVPALVLLVLALYGLTNHNALLNSDSYTYLAYARHLAAGSFYPEPGLYSHFREYWPADRTSLISANRHLDEEGTIFVDIDLGYPLILAAALKLGGLRAAFAVNPLFLLLLAGSLLYLGAAAASGEKRPASAALAALLIFLLIPPGRVFSSSLKIMRDIPPLGALAAAYAFLVAFCRGRGLCWGKLLLSSVFLAAAVAIRYTYLLYAVPYYLYLVSSLISRREPLKVILLAAVCPPLLLLAAGSPVLLKDYARSGDVLQTARAVAGYLVSPDSTGEVFAGEHFSGSGAWYLDYLWRTYTPIGLVLFLAGLAAASRRREGWALLLPLALLHFALFAFFKFKHSRYLLPVYLVLSVYIAVGIQALPSLLARFFPRRDSLLSWPVGLAALGGALWTWGTGRPPALGALALGTAAAVLPWAPLRARAAGIGAGLLLAIFAFSVIPDIFQPRSFSLGAAERLGREIDSRVPPGSLIVCARYLKQNVDMYSSSYAYNLNQISSPFGLEPCQAVGILLSDGIEVYALDNKGKRKAVRFVETLRGCFRITKVFSWRSDELGVRFKQVSENEILTLFRVEPRGGQGG